MYYYFEQGDDGEKLIITDNKSYAGPARPASPCGSSRFGRHDGSAGEALHTFTCKHHALPASVKLKDYDYAKPTLDVSGEAPVSKTGIGEISVYGERFFTPDDGKRLAKLRAEELLARQVVYRGAGTALHLRPGYMFKLEDHPRSALRHELPGDRGRRTSGNQAIATRGDARAHGHRERRGLPGRGDGDPGEACSSAPRARPPWPRIYGYENGTVVRPGRERLRADRRPWAVQRQVQVRRERPQERQGVDLRAHDAAARRRHRGLPLPAAQGHRDCLQLPRRRPGPPGHRGVVPNMLTPEPGHAGQPHEERDPDRRAQPLRARGQGGPAAHHASDALRQHDAAHGRAQRAP